MTTKDIGLSELFIKIFSYNLRNFEKYLREVLEDGRTTNPRGKVIIEKLYGLNGDIRTLEELGEEFGVSRERIRQISIITIRRMRNQMIKRFLLTGKNE
jgi:DNA-directed RNA polymerase sigma subunit (sigma70/sigma32)